MKTATSIVMALFVAVVAMGIAAAGDRLISVTGDAEVQVPPDEVVISLGVQTRDLELHKAKKENDRIVHQVIEAVKQHGVEPKQIQTEHVSIQPRYKHYDAEGFLGYFVRKSVVITLKNLSSFERVLTDALQSGANYVHGIRFRTTQLRTHRDQARLLAIKAAREKAAALAGELGQRLGKPRTIQEQTDSWWSHYGRGGWGSGSGQAVAQNVVQTAPGASDDAGETFSPGQISVKARVSVSFELE